MQLLYLSGELLCYRYLPCSMKKKWFQLILHLSSDAHSIKQRLIGADVFNTITLGIRIIFIELLLFVLSLPTYLFIKPHFHPIHEHYHIRKRLSLSIVGSMIVAWFTKLLFGAIIVLLPFENQAATTQSIAWDFNSSAEYSFNTEQIVMIDGMAILRANQSESSQDENSSGESIRESENNLLKESQEGKSENQQLEDDGIIQFEEPEEVPPTRGLEERVETQSVQPTTSEIQQSPAGSADQPPEDSTVESTEATKDGDQSTSPQSDDSIEQEEASSDQEISDIDSQQIEQETSEQSSESEKSSDDTQSFNPFSSVLSWIAPQLFAQEAFTCQGTIKPNQVLAVENITQWTGFVAVANAETGTIGYQLSNDGGSTWYFWDGASWVAGSSFNSAAEIDAHISSFPLGNGSIIFRTMLESNCNTEIQLTSVIIEFQTDHVTPTPTDEPLQSLSPVLECVDNNGDGTYTAHFGYNNPNSVAIIVNANDNSDNRFHPSPQVRNQVTSFQPGRHRFQFEEVFNGNNLVWILNNRTATASRNAPACPQPTPTVALKAISPVLECVDENSDGTFTAHFGYYNRNNFPVDIVPGSDNYFHPQPRQRNQPTTFRPGRSYKDYTEVFNGNNLVWTLNKRTATASRNSKRCTYPSPTITPIPVPSDTPTPIPTTTLQPTDSSVDNVLDPQVTATPSATLTNTPSVSPVPTNTNSPEEDFDDSESPDPTDSPDATNSPAPTEEPTPTDFVITQNFAIEEEIITPQNNTNSFVSVFEDLVRSEESPLLQPPELESVVPDTINNELIFEGKTIPNGEIMIFVHSEQALIYRARADENGDWTFKHSQYEVELSPGTHMAYALTIDRGSNVKSAISDPKEFEVKQNWLAYILSFLNLPTTLLAVLVVTIGMSIYIKKKKQFEKLFTR